MQEKEFNIAFAYNDIYKYALELAAKMQVPFEKNEVIYPSHIAKGGSKFYCKATDGF